MKLKTVIGLLLVIGSVGVMYMWETSWRDSVALTEVVVASRDIASGESADPGCFRTLKITPQSKLKGSLSPKEASLLYGKYASVSISENQQVTEALFSEKEILPDFYSDFVIPKEWIYLKSSLLIPGEELSVFQVYTREPVGVYHLRAVQENAGGVEICCSLDDFCSIMDSVGSFGEYSLLLYRHGEEIDVPEL